jgi:hypothetical protein
MSHIVSIKTQVRDAVALAAACQRLNLAPPMHGTAKLFTSEATGQIVALPGWKFPVVCELASGDVKYDNYGGRWGEKSQLDRLIQSYAVEKSRIEARKQGHTVTEQTLADGSIKLTIQVAGGAS